jgi:hypothetical protein
MRSLSFPRLCIQEESRFSHSCAFDEPFRWCGTEALSIRGMGEAFRDRPEEFFQFADELFRCDWGFRSIYRKFRGFGRRVNTSVFSRNTLRGMPQLRMHKSGNTASDVAAASSAAVSICFCLPLGDAPEGQFSGKRFAGKNIVAGHTERQPRARRGTDVDTPRP